jgi:hypothetical protein
MPYPQARSIIVQLVWFCLSIVTVLAADKLSGAAILRVRTCLCDEWVHDQSFKESLLNFDARHLADWEWAQLGDAIRAIGSTGDVRADDFAQELISTADEVAVYSWGVEPGLTMGKSRAHSPSRPSAKKHN